MTALQSEFDERLRRLSADLHSQGRSVLAVVESAVAGVFDGDEASARRVVELDAGIDREDVRIEREAVQLLTDATRVNAQMSPQQVRTVFIIVKVNNELERIADAAVNIAEKAAQFAAQGAAMPPRFRMMANSVIGILQSANAAFEHVDRAEAERVLASDDTTEAFRHALLLDTFARVGRGELAVEHGMAYETVASNLARMADHCTNIAEQVIYLATGKIVRHWGDKWTKPEEVA